MSEKTPHRRPATFKLDDANVIVMDADEPGRPARGTVHITPEAEPAQLPVPIEAPLLPGRRGFGWGTLFWAAHGGLVLLGIGLGIIKLIEDLFARSESLGWLGLGFAARRRAGARRRHGTRGVRADAACHHRKTACARRRSAHQRRPRRQPGHRRRSRQARRTRIRIWRAPAPRCRACRRHHRRRRHDQAGRARIDDAARPGGPAHRLLGRAARLHRHRGEPARAVRRGVRVRRRRCG